MQRSHDALPHEGVTNPQPLERKSELLSADDFWVAPPDVVELLKRWQDEAQVDEIEMDDAREVSQYLQKYIEAREQQLRSDIEIAELAARLEAAKNRARDVGMRVTVRATALQRTCFSQSRGAFGSRDDGYDGLISRVDQLLEDRKKTSKTDKTE